MTGNGNPKKRREASQFRGERERPSSDNWRKGGARRWYKREGRKAVVICSRARTKGKREEGRNL